MTLEHKRIFIVEDNVQNRVIFSVSLIRFGAYVEFERWGQDTAFRLKSLSHLDLIILDLMLYNNLSGFDVYDQIRALPNFANTPILAVSALDPSIGIPKARAKGFTGFIAKPIDAISFPKQLERIIEGEHIWHSGIGSRIRSESASEGLV